MRVRLDRVRGPLDRPQEGQEPLRRLDRPPIVAKQGPGLRTRVRHHQPLHTHRTLRLRDGQRKVTASSTQIEGPQHACCTSRTPVDRLEITWHAFDANAAWLQI